jgi:hypothetical protein
MLPCQLAVIGTCGRENKERVTKDLFDLMCQTVESHVKNRLKQSWSNITLVSGGAAFSDHVAVCLYLKHADEGCRLLLALPCEFVNDNQYEDNKKQHWTKNPGGLANYYHRWFSGILGHDTLKDIKEALTRGASKVIGRGFHNRNNLIAKSTYLIAFTWETCPTHGGTFDTWKKAKGASKVNIDLRELIKEIKTS